jgi:tetratricopeptide (TPR) repeat protein
LRGILGAAAAAAAILGVPAAADTITLTNGRVIEADRAWYEGTQLRYQKNGNVFGLPRHLVQSIDQRAATPPDPEVTQARERLMAGDAAGAVGLLRRVVARDPRSVVALQALAESQLTMGDAHAARESASRAAALDDNDARSHALLGDALSALGERVAAQDAYRRSLRLRPDPALEKKVAALAAAAAAAAPSATRAQFRLRYDGGINEPLGTAVLEVLAGAYDNYAARLRFRPDEPVTVVLELGTSLQDPGAPEWAAGLNDGTIHVPLRGMERLSVALVAVLRHELAHSFIRARTGGNCPTWLQEGISQWLEGGDPRREDAVVAAALRQGRLLPLLTLEGPFQSLPPDQVGLAYAESLSAVAHIVRTRGEAAIVRLLAGLGDRLPAEEALPVALALSYPEFQRSWEETLRALPAR